MPWVWKKLRREPTARAKWLIGGAVFAVFYALALWAIVAWMN